MFNPLDLLEPEEAVGNLWHDWASRLAAERGNEAEAVHLDQVRTSVAVLFRALGGEGGIEICEAVPVPARHRLSVAHRLGDSRQMVTPARFDGSRLHLPARIDTFSSAGLNRAAYLWIAALAARTEQLPLWPEDPLAADVAQVRALGRATAQVVAACPGLLKAYVELKRELLDLWRPDPHGADEVALCELVRHALGGDAPQTARADVLEHLDLKDIRSSGSYQSPPDIPIWPRLGGRSAVAGACPDDPGQAPPGAATTTRKMARRENRDQTNRRDSFIVYRFEAILSWVESLNLHRPVEDDDEDNAAKAAEDQDDLVLSQQDKKAATRLRLHLDLSPQDAEHERLSEGLLYPEWDHRARAYLPDQCRVLEADASGQPCHDPKANPALVERVRRQFEALHPGRVVLPRQVDGAELDLDQVVASRVALRTTGESQDRIYRQAKSVERDLAVAILMDCSRSTEAVIGDRSIIDTAREALLALTAGIETAGDRVGVWGFSSLRRDRVFLSRCKMFDQRMMEEVRDRIASLRPGHYTRLGTAIRHVSARLNEEKAARKLLLVLTDGKPNDLDHYEGIYGIEDSRMAVREARQAGQSVHGIVVDADGQDWFARIFGRAGFTLLPDPARLIRALPRIYTTLIEEN
ncbi:nitric oxide reductase activation protein NorD [Roseibium aestuarii]|uniref:Nitric oxide reductase activation protein NorD n=1 Tax=Roseibium aestuarii TaxID=2600299 RepID=A0ABW4JYT2_9HYPH|nr:VWA domain-containing protein [Roseibium aestuarii]